MIIAAECLPLAASEKSFQECEKLKDVSLIKPRASGAEMGRCRLEMEIIAFYYTHI